MMDSNPQHLTFTAAERDTLHSLALALSRRLHVAVTVETCAEDGDEWACFAIDDEAAGACEPLATVQLIRRPVRGYAVLRPDGRAYGSPSMRGAHGGDFTLTARYLERLAIRSALAARSQSLGLQAVMPFAARLQEQLYPLSRAYVRRDAH